MKISFFFLKSNWIDVLLIYIQIEEEFVIIKSEIEDEIRKHLSIITYTKW